jgi:SOS response regulatory protein OraA/RecX
MRRPDYKGQLVDYFKRNLRKGYTSESLKFALVRQGYSRTSVEQAIEQANKELARKAPEFKEKPLIKYEIIDENNRPVQIKVSFWKKVKGFFK